MFFPRTCIFFAVSILCLTTAMAQTDSVLIPDTPVVKLTKLFNEAMASFQGGDYTTAASDLESVISQAGPGSQLEPVYFTLGAAYFNMAQYPKAIETLKTYRDKYPKSARLADATFSIGQANLLEKNYSEAAAEFAKVENVPSYREHALLYEASADKEGGNTDAAISALEKLVSPRIKTTIGMNGAMMLTGLYVDKKEPDKAEALMGQIFEKAALVDNMIRLNSLAVEMGDRLLEEQRDKDALAAYHHVRSRDEVIQFQAGRVAALQRLVEQNVAGMKAYPAQAMQFIAANNLIRDEITKAKSLYDEALQLPDFTPRLLLREGRAWYDMDKKWESLVVFNRLLEQYPDAKERETGIFSALTAMADVNQPERARQLADEYLKEFPQGKNAETVAYLEGATALQSNDLPGAVTYFGRALEQQPDSSFKEQMRFLVGNAEFGQGKFTEAIQDYQNYERDFPNGQYIEEATYRIAVSLVFAGKYEEAMSHLSDYLQRYPKGSFAADAKYRLMVCKYAAQQYDQVIADATDWQKDYPTNDMAGEVLSIEGDSLEAQGKVAEAIPVYVESYKKAATAEVMNYSLFEAAKDMEKLRKWDDVTQLFKEFVKEKPTDPSVVAAMFWISKALSHQGKTEEAKQFLVEQLRNYAGDPRREAVEQLLQQLARLCWRRPRPALAANPEASPSANPATSPSANPAASPSATPAAVVAQQSPAGAPAPSPSAVEVPTPVPWDAMGELEKQLAPLQENANATVKARLIYAKSELETLLRKPAEHDRLVAQIANEFKPEELSPLLLAEGGDSLLAHGATDRAAMFYNELKEYFPNSMYLDYAYVGLGEIAFAKKDYKTALGLFTEAADNLAASKVKDATIGKAKTLLELGKYDDARKLFQEIATVREWRGESTAYAVYAMGEIEERQGHWAEAIAYYQRVFVLYQKYLPWVAKAYISSAESFDKLGKRAEAIGHLQEMLRNDKLLSYPEAVEARQMLQKWGASV